MREIRIEVRLKNNILYNAIYSNWKSVAAFCRDKGFARNEIYKLLSLRTSPLYKHSGEYKAVCYKLSKCFKILVEDLFPLYIYNLERKKLAKEISVVEIGLEDLKKIPYYEDPLIYREKNERLLAIRKVLGRLTPRERKILLMRFGFDDYDEHTYKEIGDVFGLGPVRVMQIIAKALRKLRHPKQTIILEKHLKVDNALTPGVDY